MTYSEVSACNVCGANSSEWHMLFSLNQEQDLVKCGKCGLVFNSAQRTDLEAIYSDEYFVADNKSSVGGYFDYRPLEKALNRNHRFASRFILDSCAGEHRKYRLLDIGCGYGYFLKQFQYDKRFELFGIELNKSASDIASSSGATIINERFEQHKADAQFDFITCFDFIEHVQNPVSTLENIREMLSHNGILLLTTPNIGSILFHLLKRRWPLIHPDSHNHYFSFHSINLMAEVHGFEVVHFRKRLIQWLDLVQLRKRSAQMFPRFAGILNHLSLFDPLCIPFISGGIIEAILRKKEFT